MEIRQALAHELPELKQRLKESGGEVIDLDSARVFVAVEDGKLLGMLPLRMILQAEPLLLFDGNPITKARAGLGMYQAMMAWIAGSGNRTGIKWLFAITRSRAVERWLTRLGWLRQYAGAHTFLRYVR